MTFPELTMPMVAPAGGPDIPAGQYGIDEDCSGDLEALLKHYYSLSPFTCSVGLSGDGKRLAAVGVKLHGNSRHRKGRWTRAAIAASCPVEQGVAGLVPKLRALYRDFATGRHLHVNTFYPRRRGTRSMRGK